MPEGVKAEVDVEYAKVYTGKNCEDIADVMEYIEIIDGYVYKGEIEKKYCLSDAPGALRVIFKGRIQVRPDDIDSHGGRELLAKLQERLDAELEGR